MLIHWEIPKLTATATMIQKLIRWDFQISSVTDFQISTQTEKRLGFQKLTD